MIRALSTASSGMSAQQLYIDNIANNLANVNTPGFKRTRVEFQDLLYENVGPVGASRMTGTAEPTFSQIGHGVRLAATTRIFKQGSSMQTENPLDMMIDGDGFFQILLPDGTYAYTRDGTFKIDSEGNLVTSSGFKMEPTLTLPRETTELLVASDGSVSVLLPAGLRSIGHNLYKPTAASGDPIVGNPGEEGLGVINMGYLEMSNVNVIEEMIGMITAQRAYEINSKAVKTAEEMLGIAANLKR